MAKIVVIGAGVSGLTTALLLSKKGHSVAIVAKHLPGDININYTSPFAGANWHSFATDEQLDLQQYDKVGYKTLVDLARNDPGAGIWLKPSVEYITKQDFDSFELPWFKDFVDGFKIMDQTELPEDIAFGYGFQSVVISVPIYLNYLLQKCVANGVTYSRSTLKHINQANEFHPRGKADVIVNCSGLLAGKLGGVEDKKVYPIRGQTILVENSCDKMLSVSSFEGYPNEMLYMMPRREGGTIIGGCFLANTYNGEVDHSLTNRIVERALKYMPQLVDTKFRNNPDEIKIIAQNVGLRPARHGGPRIEVENSTNVVHNYGIAGAGYQASYGLAEKVVGLVDQLASKAKL